MGVLRPEPLEGKVGALGWMEETTATKTWLKLDWWPEAEMVASGQVGLEPGPQAASPEDAPGLGCRPSFTITMRGGIFLFSGEFIGVGLRGRPFGGAEGGWARAGLHHGNIHTGTEPYFRRTRTPTMREDLRALGICRKKPCGATEQEGPSLSVDLLRCSPDGWALCSWGGVRDLRVDPASAGPTTPHTKHPEVEFPVHGLWSPSWLDALIAFQLSPCPLRPCCPLRMGYLVSLVNKNPQCWAPNRGKIFLSWEGKVSCNMRNGHEMSPWLQTYLFIYLFPNGYLFLIFITFIGVTLISKII